MILDSFNTTATDLIPNVCNRITDREEPSDETKQRSSSLSSSLSPPPPPPPLLARFNIDSKLSSSPISYSILNSPDSISGEEGSVMDKSSRSSSVSSDIDDAEAETASIHSSATANFSANKKGSITGTHFNDAGRSEPTNNQMSGKTCDSKPEFNVADDIKRLESIIQSLKDSTTSEISQLREMVTQKDKIIFDLTEKLDQQRDYEDIKRELTIVRSELSHFGPVVSALDAAAVAAVNVNHPNSTTNTTNTSNNNSKNGNNNHSSSQSFNPSGVQQSLVHRNPLFVPFPFSQLQSLGNVESFGSILGEEIANTYAKAMAAAAVASSNNNSDSSNNNNLKSTANVNISNSNQNNGNNTNNPTESQSPSQTSNGGDAGADDEQKSRESASATPTSAMMFCQEVVEPLLTSSPLGSSTMPTAAAAAAAVTDLGQLNQIANSYPSPSHNLFYEKLQHQLRCNVEKYMNETLNTLQISRYVRELLSVHNIGQRLFAKYVLGLSQGTVSELLSKPKPWDKLTEKGRDSYRKMHAWSTDERCINLLKMMVPRKEYGSYLGKETNPYKQDDSATEERIAQILNEAHRSGKVGMAGTRPELLAHHFMNGDPMAAKLDLMKDLKNNCNMNNDATSDNGSDERDDDKSDSCAQINERKSPLNPTAIATISNFYRNMNSESDSRNNSRTTARSNKFMDGIDADQANQQAGLISLYQDHLTKLIGQQMEEFRGGSQNCDEISPFLLQAYPDLFARLISSGMLNGAHYLPGLGLDSSQHAVNQLENLRKGSRIESPQSLRDQRDSAEPRLKIDSILGQLKSESAQSPSHNGNNTLGGVQSINNATATGANVFNNGDSDDLAASPLQRMQSITNSLLSQSSLPSLPSQPSRPAKAVLPPITQQQFDQYNNLNTEDIVKRVKEQLSQYSISQRLFGESVLGLSQGSVSDLLARPKPWHMLTQKGREPFIRMKMFLEDDNAIHKLVASQYKIAPEKLMRTGNFVSGSGIPPGLGALNTSSQLSQPQLPASPGTLSINTLNVGSNNSSSNNKNNGNNVKPSPVSSSDLMLKYEQSMSPSSVENSIRSNTSSPDMLSSSSVNNTAATTMPSVPSPLSSMRMSRMSTTAFNQINNNNGNNCQNLLRPARNNTPITPTSIQQSAAAAAAYMQPSVYELAALTSDLDTQIITTRIKETLMAHNIGQKIFGEVVLGLSQGSVSELLSKPKPWHMLSIKGREPFIRMQLWLNDANNIDKLQTLKNERREANKRRRTHLDEGLSSFKPFDNQLFNFSNSFHSLNHQLGKSLASASPGSFPLSTMNAQPVVKKARILFTEEQKEALRIAFAMDPYPSSATAEFLAKELNLSIRTITNWFHNHRMRLKQINSSANNQEESSNPAANYNLGRDSVLFDQSKFRTLLTQRLADLKLRSNNLQHSNNSNHGSSNNDNSNQFGSFGQNSPPTHQLHGRMKYSPSMFHQTQSIYSNNTNSCSSPASSSSFQEEEDMGTLDLSMTSHNPQFRISPDKLDSTGRSSMHDDSDDGLRTGEEEDEPIDSGDEQRAQQTQPDAKPTVQHPQRKSHRSGSSRRKPQNVMSSSSRRKAAQPQQWVAPVVAPPDFGDEEDYIEDEDDFENVDDFRQQSKSSEMNGDGGIYDQIKNKNDHGPDDLEEDPKTDEDDNVEDDPNDEDVEHRTILNGSLPPPHKKLKSSSVAATPTASKLALKDQDDSATIIQGCVQ